MICIHGALYQTLPASDLVELLVLVDQKMNAATEIDGSTDSSRVKTNAPLNDDIKVPLYRAQVQ